MDAIYGTRLREFGQAYGDFEAGDIAALIIRAGERLEALCLDPEAVNKAMTCLHGALGLSERNLDRTQEVSWKTVWEETSAVELLDLPLSQKLTSLNAYAFFGLSPIDRGPCTLGDIKNLIEAVNSAVTLSKPEGTVTADIDRTLLAAKARFGLDEGTGLLPDELAALVRLGQKSMRNALTPSSGSGLEVKDGRITANSALNWLNARGDFKSSIWHQSSGDVFSPAEAEYALQGEILWIPFASDQTDFDPAKCLRGGKYTVGPKGAETTFADYRQALDALARMKPTAYWRRPNSAGNWGIVSAAGFRPRSAQELGLAATEGAGQ
ncbi:hypothetical protein [Bradyrhizobium diazoefficiens]|uniref:hypothetical protein n=1 Tax=Bradyrhizobium diazoefficiens TaxID=1355477 RepID=UPI0015CF5066|nr:hypothetical protein [Bradyrhizobium diazoefficiens]